MLHFVLKKSCAFHNITDSFKCSIEHDVTVVSWTGQLNECLVVHNMEAIQGG